MLTSQQQFSLKFQPGTLFGLTDLVFLFSMGNFLISLAAFLIHFPFGFFRVRFKKFSRPWSRCLYIPIVLNIVARRFILQWEWQTAIVYLWPATLLAHVLGGLLGARHRPADNNMETEGARSSNDK